MTLPSLSPHGGAGRHPRKGNPSIEIYPLVYQPDIQKAWIYIVASKPNGVLYVGVTHDLKRRVYEHREGKIEGFTKKYNVKTLVYYEGFSLMVEAIEKEKKMKNWTRNWKVQRILAFNPEWQDLYGELI